jgi:hypothetical protein
MDSNMKSTHEAPIRVPEMTRPTGEESNMMLQMEGDYARGLRTLPVEFEGSDYARGLRTLPVQLEVADYARGLRTLPNESEGPDYARGLRSTADNTGAVTGRSQRKGLTSAGAPAAGK